MVINGKQYAEEIQASLMREIAKSSHTLSFHIIYVGSDPVIDNFIHYKKKFGAELGIEVVIHRFSETVEKDELKIAIENIIPVATAMIVQLPLPAHLDTQSVLDLIPASHDVDVLARHTRALFVDYQTELVPPVTAAIIHVLEKNSILLENKNIVVVGNGNLVGYPTTLWLEREGYSYRLVTEKTNERERNSYLKEADVIISGVGIPVLITPSMISESVVCIDAGTSESGKKIQGDFHPNCAEKASVFTPVPGGVGPLTIALLYQNIISTYFSSHE